MSRGRLEAEYVVFKIQPGKIIYITRRLKTKKQGSARTLKTKKYGGDSSRQYQLKKLSEATLGAGNLRAAVSLPEGEDLNEWIAVNTVDFYNQINMLYGTISEFCTPDECPVMSGGPTHEYLWADGATIKKPIKCSAPEYVDYLMTWVQSQLDHESIFPTKIGVPFPRNFQAVAKNILKKLFRVYAHIYHSHYNKIASLNETAHLVTSFKHFIYFIQEFGLVDKKELEPLQDLIDELLAQDA